MDGLGGAVSALVVGDWELTNYAVDRLLSDDGITVVERTDVRTLLAAPMLRGCPDALVWSIGARTDLEACRKIITRFEETPVVALVDDPGPETAVETIRAGAVSVVFAREASLHLVPAVRAAATGRSLLAPSFLQWLAGTGAAPWSVTDDELAWLLRLEQGLTVAELAAEVGYSERSLYRMLKNLNDRLGVSSRSEALSCLRRRNLL